MTYYLVEPFNIMCWHAAMDEWHPCRFEAISQLALAGLIP